LDKRKFVYDHLDSNVVSHSFEIMTSMKASKPLGAREGARKRKKDEDRKKSASRMVSKQDSGHYKEREITIVIQKVNDNIGTGALSTFQHTSGKVHESIKFEETDSRNGYAGSIRWLHRRFLDGGAPYIEDENVSVIDCAFVIIPTMEFISLAAEHEIGINDTLARFIAKIRSKLSTSMQNPTENFRLHLGLIDLITETNKWCRLATSSSGVGSAGRGSGNYDIKSLTQKVEDAIMYCTYLAGVEVYQAMSAQELGEYLVNFTKQIMEGLYTKQERATAVRSEKYQKAYFDSSEDFFPHLSLNERKHRWDNREIWVSMLRTLPGVSLDRARYFVENSPFPTPYNLYSKIASLTDPEKVLFEKDLAKMFGRGQAQNKIAKRLMTLMGNADPSLKSI